MSEIDKNLVLKVTLDTSEVNKKIQELNNAFAKATTPDSDAVKVEKEKLELLRLQNKVKAENRKADNQAILDAQRLKNNIDKIDKAGQGGVKLPEKLIDAFARANIVIQDSDKEMRQLKATLNSFSQGSAEWVVANDAVTEAQKRNTIALQEQAEILATLRGEYSGNLLLTEKIAVRQKGLEASLNRTQYAFGGISEYGRQANFTMLELGRGMSDLGQFQYSLAAGFNAIGNNIAQTVTAFGGLQSSAGGVGNALKAMASSLLGFGGFIFAVNVAVGVLPLLLTKLKMTKEKADDSAKSLTAFADALLKIVEAQSKLKGLDVFDDENALKAKQRLLLTSISDIDNEIQVFNEKIKKREEEIAELRVKSEQKLAENREKSQSAFGDNFIARKRLIANETVLIESKNADIEKSEKRIAELRDAQLNKSKELLVVQDVLGTKIGSNQKTLEEALKVEKARLEFAKIREGILEIEKERLEAEKESHLSYKTYLSLVNEYDSLKEKEIKSNEKTLSLTREKLSELNKVKDKYSEIISLINNVSKLPMPKLEIELDVDLPKTQQRFAQTFSRFRDLGISVPVSAEIARKDAEDLEFQYANLVARLSRRYTIEVAVEIADALKLQRELNDKMFEQERNNILNVENIKTISAQRDQERATMLLEKKRELAGKGVSGAEADALAEEMVERELMAKKLEARQMYLTASLDLAQTFANLGLLSAKQAFNVQKGLDVAQAITATHLGVVKAMMPKPPTYTPDIASATAIKVMGGIQIAKILSTKFGQTSGRLGASGGTTRADGQEGFLINRMPSPSLSTMPNVPSMNQPANASASMLPLNNAPVVNISSNFDSEMLWYAVQDGAGKVRQNSSYIGG